MEQASKMSWELMFTTAFAFSTRVIFFLFMKFFAVVVVLAKC